MRLQLQLQLQLQLRRLAGGRAGRSSKLIDADIT